MGWPTRTGATSTSRTPKRVEPGAAGAPRMDCEAGRIGAKYDAQRPILRPRHRIDPVIRFMEKHLSGREDERDFAILLVRQKSVLSPRSTIQRETSMKNARSSLVGRFLSSTRNTDSRAGRSNVFVSTAMILVRSLERQKQLASVHAGEEKTHSERENVAARLAPEGTRAANVTFFLLLLAN